MLHVAIITPVVHYCMGGLAISPAGEVLPEATGKAIPGLYAAGENSLLPLRSACGAA
jgi:succinate dehydrogenase/fumarate reductase flavoprotein subunit